jgi:hypothetical protein
VTDYRALLLDPGWLKEKLLGCCGNGASRSHRNGASGAIRRSRQRMEQMQAQARHGPARFDGRPPIA